MMSSGFGLNTCRYVTKFTVSNKLNNKSKWHILLSIIPKSYFAMSFDFPSLITSSRTSSTSY